MKRALAVVIAALLLAGCARNTDPRHGRVTIERSNCLTGDCTWSWKVCLGPDLHTHVDGVGNRTDRDSQECKR